MTLESLKHLLTHLLLSVNQIITNSVMVEPHLAIVIIYLNKFSEVTLLEVLLVGRSIVLNCLKLVRVSSSHHQLILSVLEVRPNLFLDESFVVLKDGHSLDQTINLHAVRKELNLTLLIEDSLLALGAQLDEFISVYKKLGGPWWWHIKNLLFSASNFFTILLFFLFIFFLLISFLVILVDHDVFPLA